MGEVLSLADAAARLEPLGGQVVATAIPSGSPAEPMPPSLRFAGDEGDEVKIFYRALEDREAAVSVLYDATTTNKVIRELCRRLGRKPDQLIATDARHIKDPFGGEPDPFGLAYIHQAAGARGEKPGEALAFVKGVSWVTLNVALKKPVSLPPAIRPPREGEEAPADDTPETLSGDDE
ncbi:hypothetical protein [Caulobacter vibrioides]|uniref:hypothetical protein n=1 Tax=Caulobacter vibrioides TaxID=155892 RepID=UPI0015E7A7E8|nr:hypothetical protein [Caulobacter vibrioides]